MVMVLMLIELVSPLRHGVLGAGGTVSYSFIPAMPGWLASAISRDPSALSPHPRHKLVSLPVVQVRTGRLSLGNLSSRVRMKGQELRRVSTGIGA